MKVLKQVVSRIKKRVLKPQPFLLGIVWGTLFFSLSSGWYLSQAYQGRIIEGVFIDGINVSGLTTEEALERLKSAPPDIPDTTITLSYENMEIASTGAQLGIKRNFNPSIEQAFTLGRERSLIHKASSLTQSLFQGKHFTSTLTVSVEPATQMVEALTPLVEKEGREPQALLGKSNSPTTLTVVNGELGRFINYQDTVQKLLKTPPQGSPVIEAVVQTSGTVLTAEQIEHAYQRATRLVGKSGVGTYEELTFTLSDQELIALLSFPEGYHIDRATEKISKWQTTVDRPAQNAELTIDETRLKVTHFLPHRNGRTLDIDQTTAQLLAGLVELEQNTELPAQKKIPFSLQVLDTKPNVSLADTNTLGISERIGFGESFYQHSIPSRIHNVNRASEIINNAIVPPGAEFSFNKALGEVSKQTGFQPAYVIKSGATVLGDGGGVCQVSTTLFRALLDSGLKISKRLPHSYRVSYYEINNEPGFDATVFAGEVDLRFVNDTDHHVLLHFTTYPKTQYMTVEIFGTSDGRSTEITDYQKWGQRAAPEPVYTDDPTLPAGKIVQVDWAVGGIRTKFTHRVKDKQGNLISEKEYYSNYIPWSAKYRRGTGI